MGPAARCDWKVSREDDVRIRKLLDGYADIRSSSDGEKQKSYFSNLVNSVESQNVIFRVLWRFCDGQQQQQEPEGDAKTDGGLLFSLCGLFLAFYRYVNGLSSGSKSATFTLASAAKDAERSRPAIVQYVPHLLAIYLMSLQRPPDERKSLDFVETLLFVIYNCEASESSPLVVNVPGLALQSSVYHDRAGLSDSSCGGGGGIKLSSGSFEPIKRVNATTRPALVHLLYRLFNNHIMDVSKNNGGVGLESFAKVTVRMLSQGHDRRCVGPRIHLWPPVLAELLLSAHHCIFNGLTTLGNRLVDLVEVRAAADGRGDVLLLVNAMTNLAKTWSGDVAGRGLRAATTDAHHAANSPGSAKRMITNASFRAKRISEDIPKVPETKSEQEAKAKLMGNMKSIAEELTIAEDELPTTAGKTVESSSGKGNKKPTAKLPNLKMSVLKRSDDATTFRTSFDQAKEEIGSLFDVAAGKKSKDKQGKAGGGGGGGDKKAAATDKKKDEKKREKSKSSFLSAAHILNQSAGGGEATVPLMSGGDQGDAAAAVADDVDTMEKVEELIQLKRLPQETITIHSPESGGTTII